MKLSTLAALLALPALAASRGGSSTGTTPAQATLPYTYVGRLMNAEHVAFDAAYAAEIAAYDAATGAKIATGETFHRENSRRNYRLQIPLASTASAENFLTTGATVEIEVTEPNGETWSGVVVDADAVVGAPGAVKEVDIILAEDENGDGIDDLLYKDLYNAWRNSPYYVKGETFDPKKDYDGDGVSTIDEVYAGTDPFDPDSVLRITAYVRESDVTDGETAAHALTFTVAPGRAYTLEAATSLETKDWAAADFHTAETAATLNTAAAAPVNVLSVPCTTRPGPATVYLFPKTPARFFRVKSE